MKKSFVLDAQKRIDHHRLMSHELSKLLQVSARFTSGISKSPEEEVAIVLDGLREWRLILDKFYHCLQLLSLTKLLGDLHSSFNKGWLYHSSVVPEQLCANICEAIDSISSDVQHIYSQTFDAQLQSIKSLSECIQSVSDYVQFIPASISASHEAHLWRAHIYEYDNSSLSNRWHYDLEISDNIFFVMLFLEDSASSSTAVYDADISAAISASDGYIGSPVKYRSSSLECYSSREGYRKPSLITARAGSALVFMPSRCLHRGICFPTEGYYLPTGAKRRVLHLSYLVTSEEYSLPFGVHEWDKTVLASSNTSVPPFLS